MKRLKEQLHSHAAEWAPRIAFIAVFGVTGVAVMALHRGYKSLHNTVKMLESKGYEDPNKD